ncbi:MAG: hypothetical protein CL868_15905 [Cytophagaceae bacterium]|nr:hypothetical protein [Cytophagaceae bacterium]|tara:strand:- start:65 stop:559 length:495 start_codon:yes stop_codon:yes gene_type:complete
MIMLGTSMTQASEINDPGRLLPSANHAMMQPVVLVEQGVKFYLYPDGSIEYGTSLNNGPTQNNFRGNAISRTSYYRNQLQQRQYVAIDRMGRIYRVGTVNIRYDILGRVTQVGSLDVDYKRGLVDTVGRMKVHYDRYGTVTHYTGRLYQEDYQAVAIGDRSRRD